jgi:hypothetical protein
MITAIIVVEHDAKVKKQFGDHIGIVFDAKFSFENSELDHLSKK